MPEPNDPYSRMYWRFIDEFPEVYEHDGAFALWCRLLITADMAWPASGALPHGTKLKSFRLLEESGLVRALPASRYRIPSMDKERAKRSSQAAEAGRIRASGAPRTAGRFTSGPPAAGGNTVPAAHQRPTSLAEPSQDKPSQDEQNARAPDELHSLQLLAEELCSQPYALVNLNGRLGERVKRQLAKHGLAATITAWREAASAVDVQPPEVGQVILGASDILDPPPRRLSSAELKERELAEGRAWFKTDA